MKLHKKGQTEDFSDWLLLVIGLIFLMIFLQLVVIQPLSDKAEESVNLFESSSKVNDYLVEKRAEMDQGIIISPEQVNLDLLSIRRDI